MDKRLLFADILCVLANSNGKELSMGLPPQLRVRRRLAAALVVAVALELLTNADF